MELPASALMPAGSQFRAFRLCNRLLLSLGRGDPFEARAQALAPVREARRVRALAAQHRIRGARRRAAELGRRDSADPAYEPRLREDRLGELGPRALPLR